MKRILNAKGEFDYDFEHDVLFFKTKNREYDHSIELDGIVVDVDKQDFIVGIQIFDASTFLNVSKVNLRSVPKWEFRATLHDSRLEVRLAFQIIVRNRIIEKEPIIIQQVAEHLRNSEMVAVPA